jgi:hypothetical protein
MDQLFHTFWEVKGFNRFFDVPKQTTQKEQLKLLTEVFEDMAISGGKREGILKNHFWSISTIFFSFFKPDLR